MTVLQGVLTSAGLVAVLMGLIWRMFVHFDAKNEQAHATIDDRAERRAEAHRAALEAQRATLESIARDVSFPAAGRTRPAGRPRQRLSVRRCLRVNLVVLPEISGRLDPRTPLWYSSCLMGGSSLRGPHGWVDAVSFHV